MTQPATPGRTQGSAIVATSIAVAAFLFAALGLVVISTSDNLAPSAGVATGAAAPVAVDLTDFKITPAVINASAGNVKLTVKNSANQVHNLSVTKLNKKTSDLAGGKSETLDLGNVAAGTYEVICTIPGHAEAGMKGTLVVGAAGSTASAASDPGTAGMDHSGADVDYAAMEEKMKKGMKENLDLFVKGDSTKGVGNQRLTPTVEADGTKVFNLESEIVDWEVSPGKTVKAWAYNGQVPGPWIRTEPNDKVKVVIHNKLPVSTDIHFHGISTPFEQDGVAPITQEYIEPGQTYTYQWTNPNHSELGMYHAHDHGNIAVLNGMFAIFQVGDVALPSGRTISGRPLPADLTPTQELPMVLNDAGTIGLSLNGKGYPSTAPISAKPGDKLLVHYYNEGLQAHPMHLHRIPQLIVAKDGIALDQPYWADTINIAPGERYSVLIMPGPTDVGIWAYHCHILTHAENDTGLFGMVTALIVADPNAKS